MLLNLCVAFCLKIAVDKTMKTSHTFSMLLLYDWVLALDESDLTPRFPLLVEQERGQAPSLPLLYRSLDHLLCFGRCSKCFVCNSCIQKKGGFQ